VTLDSLSEISKFLKKLSGIISDYGKNLGKLAKEAQKSSKSVDQEIGCQIELHLISYPPPPHHTSYLTGLNMCIDYF
jgi:hypothetical protein